MASWDEAVYATAAKEMAQSGDWLRLTFGRVPWVDKPPLAIWFTAVFYKWLGVNEFSARLFSALCGIGTVIVTYFFGRAVFNRWIGFLGALVLLSSSVFFRFSRFGMLDAPLTFFFSLALYFFWIGRIHNRCLILSGVATGFALMVKGFAAFFIFPVVWIYCFWAGEIEILGRSSYWIGVMIAAAIALPWHLYLLFMDHQRFMQDMFIRHLFLRTASALDGHSGGVAFYVRVLVNKYHPWVIFAVLSVPFFLFKAIWERAKGPVFMVSWMLVIFISATLIQTKLSWYIFPIYPALSLTVGYLLSNLCGDHRAGFVKVLFVAIMLLHIPYSHIFNHDYSHDMKGIAESVKRATPADKLVYLYNFHESPAAYFYLDRKNAYLDDKASFLSAARDNKDFYCLIHEKDLAGIREALPALGLAKAASFENFYLITRS